MKPSSGPSAEEIAAWAEWVGTATPAHFLAQRRLVPYSAGTDREVMECYYYDLLEGDCHPPDDLTELLLGYIDHWRPAE